MVGNKFPPGRLMAQAPEVLLKDDFLDFILILYTTKVLMSSTIFPSIGVAAQKG
jgi:hypothetical protein